MRVLADLLRALAMKFVQRRQTRYFQLKATPIGMRNKSRSESRGSYFFRKRSSRTTSAPPPVTGFSGFSRLEAGAGGRGAGAGSVVTAGASGLVGTRFFLLSVAGGSRIFAGVGRSSPWVISSNCKPNWTEGPKNPLLVSMGL